MKILMLTPYLPYPPSSGGQIRSYNLIKQLSKNHEITLVSLIKFDDEKKYIEKLERFCKKIYVFKRPEKPFAISNILRTGFSLFPLLVIRNFSSELKKELPKIIKGGEFDIIHAETFYVSPHLPKTDIPIVLVDQTIEYQVYQHFVESFKFLPLRPMLFLDVAKIKFWETYYWKRASKVVAVSERDASLMESLVQGLKVTVIPNGVGEDLMGSIPLHFCKKILFIGNYAWLQNVEAAKVLALEVLPKIVQQIAGVKLVIAGQNTEKVANLASINIEVKNLKIDDSNGVKRAYQTSGVLVAPLYGPGGTRLKILAAMAAKLPVVTTKIGIEGIDAKNEHAVLFGESVDDLANLTVRVLSDKKLYTKIALNARNLVEQKYSYQSIAKSLGDIYEELGQKKD